MSFLGILKNVAKVGVGLLNNVLNGSSSTSFEDACDANPELVYTDSATNIRYVVISKYVIDHPDETRLGAQPASPGLDGEVSVVLAKNSAGATVVHAVNHSKSPYLFTFSRTSPASTLSATPMIVNGTDSTQGNVTDITPGFLANPSGDLTATRMENNDQEPSPGTLMLPALSTVLANVGIRNIISTVQVLLFAYKQGNLSLIWRTDPDGSNIIGFTVRNTTILPLNITCTLSWSNPATASTYNASVAANGTQNVDIQNADYPMNSASLAVFSSDPSLNRQVIYDSIAQQSLYFAKRLNVHYRTASQANGGHCHPRALQKLSDSEKKQLKRIAPSLASSDYSDFSPSVQQLITKIGGLQSAISAASQIKGY